MKNHITRANQRPNLHVVNAVRKNSVDWVNEGGELDQSPKSTTQEDGSPNLETYDPTQREN